MDRFVKEISFHISWIHISSISCYVLFHDPITGIYPSCVCVTVVYPCWLTTSPNSKVCVW